MKTKSKLKASILLAAVIYCMTLLSCRKDNTPATISTSDVRDITSSTAISGGIVSDEGGTDVIARGVCWSTTSNPTIEDFHTNDGKGSGSFTSHLSGLSHGTTYHLRAYAENTSGIVYGNQVSFVPLNPGEVFNSATGRIWLDRNLGASQVSTWVGDENSFGDLYQWGRVADGHEYRGSATTYTLSSTDSVHHGNFILRMNPPYDWRVNQNDQLWQGVNGINNPCPEGFRIPTKDEWVEEIATWGGRDHIAAFNSTLKLPLAGYRFSDRGFLFGGAEVKYWSSSVSEVYAYILFVGKTSTSIRRSKRADGHPIRCIKD